MTDAAGVTGLVVGQPFDVVKVRYQTPSYNARYSSTFGALGAILREEGVSEECSACVLEVALMADERSVQGSHVTHGELFIRGETELR